VNRPAARAGKGIRPYPARVKLGARRSLPLPARPPCGPSILPTGRDGAADETGRTTVLDNNTTKIRDLNDSFRRKLVIGGTVLLTPGVTSLQEFRVAELLELVRESTRPRLTTTRTASTTSAPSNLAPCVSVAGSDRKAVTWLDDGPRDTFASSHLRMALWQSERHAL
jgi:hypothetical protein